RSLHSAHRQRFFVVHGLHRAAHHRRVHHGRGQHSFHPRVLPIHAFARTQILQVIPGRVFADVAPFAPRLQLQFFFLRHFLLSSRGGQSSVSQLLPGFFLHHGVQFRRAFLRRHIPLLRGSPHQHQP